jgi:ATP-binding cassette subfamily B protein/subfamily B ATP-binding cassette protein MsbA
MATVIATTSSHTPGAPGGATLDLLRLARLLHFARPYRARWTGIVVLTLLTCLVALLIPWPMQVMVDHVLGTAPMPPALARVVGWIPASHRVGMLIAWIVSAEILLFLASALLDAVLTCAWVRVGQGMVYDLSLELFARAQRRSLAFHARAGVGDLMSRITGDAWGIYAIVETMLLAPSRAVLMTVLMTALMARIDWRLTLLALAAAPFMGGASYWLAPPIRAASKLRREVESKLLAHVQQILSGISVVQAFVAEEREEERFRAHADAALRAQTTNLFADQLHQLGTGLIATLGATLVLWLGVRHVLIGALTLGGVLVFVSYLGALQEQMKVFVSLWSGVQNISANVERLAELLEHPVEIIERPKPIVLPPRVRGALRFDSVSFGYDSGRDVLRGVSFDVPAGSKLAIVGPSGAGKSTLAGLVPRLFDPRGGRVLLDGCDLRDLALASVRQNVAVVFQEPFLFPISIAANIAFGRLDATRRQIEEAAAASGADAFIRRLPQGYDTVIGQRGMTLSGGERQRLSIARALVKDAPVLVLDEPTASLDVASEAGLLDALRRLMIGRTTLVVAHRLSTVKDADQIIALANGSIAESGSHEELIARDGLYADLYWKQMRRWTPALT